MPRRRREVAGRAFRIERGEPAYDPRLWAGRRGFAGLSRRPPGRGLRHQGAGGTAAIRPARLHGRRTRRRTFGALAQPAALGGAQLHRLAGRSRRGRRHRGAVGARPEIPPQTAASAERRGRRRHARRDRRRGHRALDRGARYRGADAALRLGPADLRGAGAEGRATIPCPKCSDRRQGRQGAAGAGAAGGARGGGGVCAAVPASR